MPASSFPDLLNFEGHFETAGQAILAASGVTAFVTQYKAQLPLASVAIGLSVDPALDQLTDIPKPPGWPADQAPPQEYFRYPASFSVRIEVPRDRNSTTAPLPGVATLLEEFRGLVRGALMRVTNPFDASNLPLYRVSDIRPNGGGEIATDLVRNVDLVVLRFRITFEIRPDAWPIA